MGWQEVGNARSLRSIGDAPKNQIISAVGQSETGGDARKVQILAVGQQSETGGDATEIQLPSG